MCARILKTETFFHSICHSGYREMKTLGKVTISALLIVYGFIGFAILSPLITVLTMDSMFLEIGLSFSLLFFMLSFMASRSVTIQWKGIFSRLEDDNATKTWLLLHSFFTFFISQIFPIVAGISSVAPIFLVPFVNAFPMTLMSASMILLLCIIGLWSLHLIIGMGYRWFCKGTTIGIRSFSALALQHLRNKERKGIASLLKASLLLRDCLKHEELELQELNDAIKAIKCFLQFKSNIPYDSLQKLTLQLKRFPSIEHLPTTLSTFNRSKKVQWTRKFTVTEKTKRKVQGLIVAIAAILSGLTFLPETTRTALFEILQSVGSTNNIQVIMGLFFLVVSAYILSLIGPYTLNLSEVRKFTFSEAKQPTKENVNGPSPTSHTKPGNRQKRKLLER